LKRTRLRKALIIITIAVSAVVLATLVMIGPFLYEMLRNPYNDRPFDRKVWLSAADDDSRDNPRGPMAEDLRRRFLRKGMAKKEVRSLLGDPRNSWYEEARGREDHYFLGYWGYMSMDGDYLVVHYDKAGKATSTEIYSH